MRPLAKTGWVAAGYGAALAIAVATVGLYVAVTSGPARQNSSGMFAFGDSLLFLAVFGVAAIPATGGALFFLRPCRPFWRVLSLTACGIASTGLVAAFVACLAIPASDWVASSVLRILMAPLFATTFLLAGLFAPNRSFRMALLVAAAIEASVFVVVAIAWLLSLQSR